MIDIIKKQTERGFGKSSFVGGFMSQLVGNSFMREYEAKKYKIFNELKGGIKTMETKSRYEVIADLEEKKRSLILARDSLGDDLKGKKRTLRDMKRDIEDQEESIKDFEESMKEQKETTNELIKSVDESLNRFAKISEKK